MHSKLCPYRPALRNIDNVLRLILSEQRISILKAMLTADDIKLKIEEHERHISSA